MAYRGFVKNGVVVFSGEARPAEGTEVEIIRISAPLDGGLPKTFRCDDAHAFLREVKNLGQRGWIFRGHARAVEWRLEPSLHRFLVEHGIKKSSWYVREKETLRRFRAVAHLYLSHLPHRQDQLSWLSLVRHHGGPTRLLDFTFNPAVAMYFAVREARPEKGAFCVHALHLASIRNGSREKRASLPIYRDRQPPSNPQVKEYCIGEGKGQADFVGLFDPPLASERLAAQDGLFVVPSRIDLDLESWLRDLDVRPPPRPHNARWLKYEFRYDSLDHYTAIVKQLAQMGMSAARLFPGLTGLCESMGFAWHEPAKDLSPDEDE